MVSQITPPPSSSPGPFALDKSTATPNRTSFALSRKRKDSQPGPDDPRAAKRQSLSANGHLEQDGPRYNGLQSHGQAATAAGAQDQGPNGQPHPPPPFARERENGRAPQQQQVDTRVSRLHGRAASKRLSRAAIGKLPEGGLLVSQGQAVIQPAPSGPAQPPPPPRSTRSHEHWVYSIFNAGPLAYQQSLWPYTNAPPIPQPTAGAAQPQHYTQWVTAPSMSGPPHVMSQPQGPPPTGHDLSRPLSSFPGHYQPHPVFQQSTFGTACRPDVLGAAPQTTASDTPQAGQQPLPPYIPSVYSLDCTPVSREHNANHIGAQPCASLPPMVRIGGTSNLLPVFSEHNVGTVGSTPSLWHDSGTATMFSKSTFSPYDYLNPRPGTLPSTLSNEYHRDTSRIVSQIPINIPPSISTPSHFNPPTTALTPKFGPPKAPLLTDEEPSLCPEQSALVDLIVQGHNVFYTGSAGCGKSTVLRAFVKRLTDKGKTVRIVAPTGRAALNVGGMTTWTFAGWTPDFHKKELQRLGKEAMWSSKVNKRLRETDVLVIDEISMVENLHFERLNEIMKAVHQGSHAQNAAFGGCQIVVTGDFCQLPPVKPFQHCIQCGKELTQKIVPGGKPTYHCRHHGDYADEDKWAFRSKAWEECDFKNVHLKTIHRQIDEPFIRMLQKCRLGIRLSEQEIHLLMNHKNRTSQAMELYPTRKEADDVNWVKFNKIAAETHTYWAHDSFFWHKEHHSNLQWKGVPSEWRNSWTSATPQTRRPLKALDEHRYSECVQLKKGGLVVLLTNLDLKLGLCNGSQGVICGFEDYDPAMMPTRDVRSELSWGKKNIDKVEPKSGQRILRGEHAGIQEREIANFISGECAPIKKWPIVRFHNGQKCTVYAKCSITQLGDEEPYSLLARTQLPLAPAWAMTIHKSQSLTLDRVIVNLDRVFEEGQVYVALSRATGLYGLKIEGSGHFLRDKIMVNSEVAAFLRAKFGSIYGNGILDAEAEEQGAVEAT